MIGNVGVLEPAPKPVTRKGAKMAEPTTAQRMQFAKTGVGMPGTGAYYIRNGSDLHNAIEAVGRGEAAGDSGSAIRLHIMKRAAALKMTSAIPDTWNSDGTLKVTHADVEAFLMHYGVLGMHWGHRKGSAKGEPSEDAARASELHGRVKKGGGVHVLSNPELEDLNKRLNLERNYHGMISDNKRTSTGKKSADNVLDVGGKIAKGSAQTVGQKIAVKGIEIGLKKAGLGGVL